MKDSWSERFVGIQESFSSLLPELVLLAFFLTLLVAGMFRAKPSVLFALGFLAFLTTTAILTVEGIETQTTAFKGMLQIDGLATFLKILLNISGAFTCVFYATKTTPHRSEFFALLIIVVLGGHILVMSKHFLLVFLSIEMISIPSYVLAGYAFSKEGSEGSIK